MSSAIEDWDRIIHKNVRSKDMEGIGNIVAVQEDSIIVATEGAQHEYKIPKSHVEGYNGAEVFLDFSVNKLSTYDVINKSQTLAEESSATALTPASSSSPNLKSPPPPTSSTTPIPIPIPTQVSKRPEVPPSIENRVPVKEEKEEKSSLPKTGLSSTQKATITKKPMSETKTVNVVPVTKEESTAKTERKPMSSTTATTTTSAANTTTTTRPTEEQVSSKTEVNTMPSKKKKEEEQPEVSKQSSVSEEVSTANTSSSGQQQQQQREEQQQQAISRAIDETKDNIRKTTDEARSQIPRYMHAVSDYQEQAIQAAIEIADHYVEAQKQIINSFQSALTPYVENVNATTTNWTTLFSQRRMSEVYANILSTFANNVITATRVTNNMIFANMEAFKTSLQQVKESAKDFSRIGVNTAKTFEQISNENARLSGSANIL